MVISYKCVAVAVIFPPLGREGSEEEMGLFWVFGFAWLRGLNSVQLTLCPSEQSVMMLPFQDPKPYPPPSSELQCLLAAGEAPRRMRIGFENKGSTSRLREQRYDPKFGDLWPVYAVCSWLLQLCWWLYVGGLTDPSPVLGWFTASLIALRQEGCQRVTSGVGEGEGDGEGGSWCSLLAACSELQALRALRAPAAKLQPRQALAQQLRSAPGIPDKGKIIAVSSYNQLAARRSHHG